MINIDGSEGEGGGQVLRYACALSLLTGEPFTIERVRGGRAKPGLMRQHVTAIEAACVVGGAECSGLAVGSDTLTFRPGRVRPGDYHFAVGTAGSTGLILQSILVPLMLADAPSRLVLEGGTHNMMAPPFEFIERCLLPVINRMGPKVSARLVRHGFFPRGGGRIEVEIDPAPLRPIDCLERGDLKNVAAMTLYTSLPGEIAVRANKAARKELSDWAEDAFAVRELPADEGPGLAVLVEAQFENVTEVVSGFGKLGVPAEQIGRTCGKRMAGYIASGAFTGPFLQDQLLLPFAMAGGGSFTSVKLSQHTRTAAQLIERFTGRTVRVGAAAEHPHLVEIR